MNSLTPVLSAVCLATVGLITAAHHAKTQDDPLQSVDAFVGDETRADPLRAVVDQIDKGETPAPPVKVLGAEVTSTELEYAAWRWQNLREIAARAGRDPAPSARARAAAPPRSSAKRSASRADTRGRRTYGYSGRSSTGVRSVFERSKRYRRAERAYQNGPLGSRYRGSLIGRSRVDRALRANVGSRSSIFERSKRYSRSGSIFERRQHAERRYSTR